MQPWALCESIGGGIQNIFIKRKPCYCVQLSISRKLHDNFIIFYIQYVAMCTHTALFGSLVVVGILIIGLCIYIPKRGKMCCQFVRFHSILTCSLNMTPRFDRI